MDPLKKHTESQSEFLPLLKDLDPQRDKHPTFDHRLLDVGMLSGYVAYQRTQTSTTWNE